MKMLMAMMLVLALPLLLVAEDGWRTWDAPKPAASATRSASNIDWLPDPKAEHPIAKAMNEEGFPPRSVALAVKEKEAVKASVAPQLPKAEEPAAPQYIEVPLYDRRGRKVGTQRQLVSPQASLSSDSIITSSDSECTTNSSGGTS